MRSTFAAKGVIYIIPQFYSYLWLRENGEPYYAGKGKDDRAFAVKTHKVNPPSDRSYILVFPMLSEAEAFESEKAMIWLFGRQDNGTGCLKNVTNGGGGTSGYIVPEESRRRMGISQRGNQNSVVYKRSERGRQEASERFRGNKYGVGRKHSAETKAKQSVSALLREERKRAARLMV
ncbi:MAG: NUMOD3 domain-containing DNA-binding protein [Candidatus Acidiferrales bacterium]